eukprot:7477331-Pyramimonas_sp.AAC.1
MTTPKLWGLEGLDAQPLGIALPPGHRFRLGLWSGLCTGGVVVGSVYLRAGIGCRGQNLTLLHNVGEVLRAYGMPFILDGDFQFP